MTHDKDIFYQKVTVEDLRKFRYDTGIYRTTSDYLYVEWSDRGYAGQDSARAEEMRSLNSIRSFWHWMKSSLDFEEDALRAIAEKAMEKDTGARALRAIIEEFMLDIMYEIPKDDNIGEVAITRGYIEGNGGPRILLRGQEVPLLESGQ